MATETPTPGQDSVAAIRQRLDEGGISFRQVLIILVCFLVNFVDGYDVIAIAMAAPTISQQWNISPEVLGYILSAELVGMSIGAVILAALGDRYGRRTVLVPSVLLVMVSTFFTAYVDSVSELVAARLATGFGVGGVLTSAATLASEYAATRQRAAVVTLVTMGFSVGSLLAGFLAAYSLEHYGWQMIFLIGSGMGAVILLLAILFVPESLEFLAGGKGADGRTLAQVNRTLTRLGLAPLEKLRAPEPGETVQSGGLHSLLAIAYLKTTLLLWGLFFALFWANYGAGKWFPKLLVADSFTINDAVFALTVWVFGGVVGSLSISLLSLRFSITRVIGSFLALSAVVLASFAVVRPETIAELYPMMFMLGLSIGGAMTGTYSIPVTLYPTQVRSLGLGCCIGVGRTGAIVAPIATGYLVAAGADTAAVLLQVTLPSVIVALGLLVFVGRLRVSQC